MTNVEKLKDLYILLRPTKAEFIKDLKQTYRVAERAYHAAMSDHHRNRLFEFLDNYPTIDLYIDDQLKRRKNEYIIPKVFSYLVTINPKKSFQNVPDMKRLMAHLAKQLRKPNKFGKLITKGVYCFEQRGETPDTVGKGVHAHLLLNLSTLVRKSYIRDNLRYTLSKKFPCIDAEKINDNNILNVQIGTTQEGYENLMNYIQGIKTKDKAAKVANDKIFREIHSLQCLYDIK
jgi:hypothetical protein